MKHNQSAFLTRISRHIALEPEERDALVRLENHTETRSKRDPVFSADRPDDRIAILRSGWAVSRVRSSGNQTTITQIYMAGDLIGLSDLGFDNPPHDVNLQTDGVVSLLSRTALHELMVAHPRLFALVLSLSSLDAAAMNDRLHAITRLSAEDRLMHFLLSMKSKTEQTSEQTSDRFPLPLSQKEIGDALGLTDIYVNRLLRSLQKSGQLTLSRPYIKINDRQSWEQRLDFQDRYSCVDVDWAC